MTTTQQQNSSFGVDDLAFQSIQNMGSNMGTEAAGESNDDRFLMPPPRKILRKNSPELHEAVRKGDVLLSIPQEQEVDDAYHHHSSEENSVTIPFIDNNNGDDAEDYSLETTIRNNGHLVSDRDPDRILGPSDDEDDNNNKLLEEEDEEGREEEGQESAVRNAQQQQQGVYPISNDESSAKEESKFSKDLVSTRFCDIIGHGAAKLRLDEVLLPLALPRDLTDSILTGVRSLSSNILLFGPPGCGKTQLARAIAGEAQAAFLAVGPSDILSKYVGESENAISSLFEKAHKKAQEVESKMTVIFFDEIDALGQARGALNSTSEVHGGTDSCPRPVLAELLIQLNRDSTALTNSTTIQIGNTTHNPEVDEYSETQSVDSTFADLDHETNIIISNKKEVRIIVVAATNRPEDCDSALIRRFTVRVLVGLPGERDRRKMLKHFLHGIEHTLSPQSLRGIASTTDGWSGSDLESLTREAAMAPVRECIRSAARLKRRALQREQRSGDVQYQVERIDTADNPHHDMAQQKLLERFQNLRPVSKEDFDEAIHFWNGNHNAAINSSRAGGRIKQDDIFDRQHTHYDSSSDEDDYY